jgi:hypothetical protein
MEIRKEELKTPKIMIKELIGIILIFIVLNSNVKSQDYTGGIFVGYSNFNCYNVDDELKSEPSSFGGRTIKYESINGYTIGFIFKKYISSRLDFTIEPNFVKKGFKMSIDEMLSYNDKYEINLSYLQIPFYFNLKLNTRLKGKIGMDFGYLINARQYKDINWSSPFTEVGKKDMSIINSFANNFAFGGNIGLRYSPARRLGINFIYSFGLIPQKHFYFSRLDETKKISYSNNGYILNIEYDIWSDE